MNATPECHLNGLRLFREIQNFVDSELKFQSLGTGQEEDGISLFDLQKLLKLFPKIRDIDFLDCFIHLSISL